MNEMIPRGGGLNATQKLIVACLATGMSPQDIEQFTDTRISSSSVYRLKKHPAVKKYLEEKEESYIDKLLTARAKTNTVLMNAAEAAAEKIAHLSKFASNEETQRKAANDILTISGIRTPERVDHTMMPHLHVVFDEGDDISDADALEGVDEDEEGET